MLLTFMKIISIFCIEKGKSRQGKNRYINVNPQNHKYTKNEIKILSILSQTISNQNENINIYPFFVFKNNKFYFKMKHNHLFVFDEYENHDFWISIACKMNKINFHFFNICACCFYKSLFSTHFIPHYGMKMNKNRRGSLKSNTIFCSFLSSVHNKTDPIDS